MSKTSTTKVLYIAGLGRSGSTLLDLILGQVEGFCSGGELRNIWQRGFCENQLCGCGAAFRDCDFWRQVVDKAYGGFFGIDPAEMIALQGRLARARYVPQLVGQIHSKAYWSELQRYRVLLRPLYGAIAEVSGADVVVDSSKSPTYGMVIRGMEEIAFSAIHLVRDSRGVGHSWQRKRRRPEVHWKEEYMLVVAPKTVAWNWVTGNVLCEGFRAGGTPYCRVRYEDLIKNPIKSLGTIFRTAGIAEPINLPLTEGLASRVNHTVSGNPLRFQGEIKLKCDDEWKRTMPFGQQWLMTALTWPLMLYYGYRPRFSRK
jgi:hypothetical protein